MTKISITSNVMDTIKEKGSFRTLIEFNYLKSENSISFNCKY